MDDASVSDSSTGCGCALLGSLLTAALGGMLMTSALLGGALWLALAVG